MSDEEGCFGCGKTDVQLSDTVTGMYGFNALMCDKCNEHDMRFDLKSSVDNLDWIINKCIQEERLGVLLDFDLVTKLDSLKDKITSNLV